MQSCTWNPIRAYFLPANCPISNNILPIYIIPADAVLTIRETQWQEIEWADEKLERSPPAPISLSSLQGIHSHGASSMYHFLFHRAPKINQIQFWSYPLPLFFGVPLLNFHLWVVCKYLLRQKSGWQDVGEGWLCRNNSEQRPECSSYYWNWDCSTVHKIRKITKETKKMIIMSRNIWCSAVWLVSFVSAISNL